MPLGEAAGEGGLPLLVSPVIPAGFRHGFTLRAGGVSPAPYDSLNLGKKWGDDPANVAENRARVARAAGGPTLRFVRQVHGARVVAVSGGDGDASAAEADGLCTADPGLGLAVFVADCVPALLADARTGACAAVHAGWRGTVADILGEAVRTMAAAFGTRPADLRAALGPAIGPCCFEVGPEVVEGFTRVLPGPAGAGVVAPGAHKPHVDLRLAQRRLLERAGLAPEAIDAARECTRCDPGNRFFSYRRDGTHTGQHVGFIARQR